MNYFSINGKSYDVSVIELSENFNILYSENTGRTIAARMVLDPLGTFLGHKVTVKRKNGSEDDFDALFNEISQPRAEGVWITAVHDQSTISYEAYISNGERRLKSINPKTNKVYWDTITINIIPMEAYYKV
jgi:hypothetical protein